MNIAIDKKYKTNSSISRYATIPIYYNVIDKKYFRGLDNWINNETSYSTHIIKNPDTLDSLALNYFGNPTLYWIIAEFNRMTDPFQKLVPGETIKIPDFSNLELS